MRSHCSTAVVITIFWFCSNIFISIEASPVVQIKNGTLEGTVMKSRNGREFWAFRGIPYAKPPVGELRFEVRTGSLNIIKVRKNRLYHDTYVPLIHTNLSREKIDTFNEQARYICR